MADRTSGLPELLAGLTREFDKKDRSKDHAARLAGIASEIRTLQANNYYPPAKVQDCLKAITDLNDEL